MCALGVNADRPQSPLLAPLLLVLLLPARTNGQAITVSPQNGLVTTEAGGVAQFTMVLTTAPTHDVTIPVATSDPSESFVSPLSLTFSPTNFATAQTVTITGVNDDIDDGDVSFVVQTGPAVSSDASYNNFNPADVRVTNTDDDTAGITVTTGGLVTSEGGGRVTFTVVLDSRPFGSGASIVSIPISSQDTTEGTVTPASLTFTSGNWNTPQTVTVKGADDRVDDGDVTYTVAFGGATSSDAKYNTMKPADIVLTNTDDDTFGIDVSPKSGLVTTEKGGTGMFTVVLASEPLDTVSIPVASSMATEGKVGVTDLIFTRSNWNVVQTVTVTGVDDKIDDGNVAYQVTLSAATSTDMLYNMLDPDDVSVTNTDDDTAGIAVDPQTGLITTEALGTATFTVVLTSEPTADVTIPVASSDTTEGTVPAAPLTFTRTSWSTKQTVTVTGADDAVVDGTVMYQIVATAMSADNTYQGLTMPEVTVSNTDNDQAGVVVSPTTRIALTEAGGTGTFSLVLTSEPTGSVSFAVQVGDTTECRVSANTVKFTSATWNVAQTVTLTGVDDSVADGDVLHTVGIGPGASTDSLYSGLKATSVLVLTADDDTAGVTVTPLGMLSVDEAGSTALVTVVLSSQPVSAVDLAIESQRASEVAVGPSGLTFTTANWNTAQTITFIGVDDAYDDGDQSTRVVIRITSSDSVYRAVTVPDLTVVTTDDDTAAYVVSPTAPLATSEAGARAVVSIRLSSQPTADVSVSFLSSHTGEALPSPPSVVFTTTNWNAAQTMTVRGVDDAVEDGDVAFTISLKASTADSVYAGLATPQLTGVNADDDTHGVKVSHQPNLFTSEVGGSVQFTVELTSQPLGGVTIPITSSDTTEGTVSADTLLFTDSNWNAKQTVVVTGMDDPDADGDTTYTIQVGPLASSDRKYDKFDPPDITVVNRDNDTAGVTVDPVSGLLTDKAGRHAFFTVVLKSRPTHEVTIPVASQDLTEGTVEPSSLTFAPAAWNTPQTVTVKGVDDAVADGNVLYTVAVEVASSTDVQYDGINPPDVTVTNLDDDMAAIVVSPVTGLRTSEGGSTATFTVVLGSQPTGDVNLPVSSSNDKEGTASSTSLVFTPASWNIPQTVTVTGMDDMVDDGDTRYSIVSGRAFSSDSNYNGIDPPDVDVVNTDDDSAGIVVSDVSGVTTESGGTFTFTIVLNSAPTASVTIPITSSNTREGSVSPSSIVFTATNWNQPGTVTVTGVDDSVDDGDTGYTVVVASPSSLDAQYATMGRTTIAMVNSDDDTVGYVITPSTGLVTTEGGGSATFTIVLSSQPLATVAISCTSSDASEGTVTPASLTFPPLSWNVPLTVTITGKDDFIDDGDVVYSIELSSSGSADTQYAALDVPDVSGVTNQDDDTLGVAVAPLTGLTTSEGGGTAIFTVVLDTQPEGSGAGTVSIPLQSDNPSEGVPSVSSVLFTSANWNVPQTVTVLGVDDKIADGDVSYKIILGPVTSTGSKYNKYDPADVTVTNTDNDVVGVTVDPLQGLRTTEKGGEGVFTVVLDSRPTHPVTIPVVSLNAKEGNVKVSSVQFTGSSWNIPQSVVVRGVDDTIDDGDTAFQVAVGPAMSTDPAYNNFDPPDVSVVNEDDDISSFVVSAPSSVTTEKGGHVVVTIKLSTQPQADVTVPLSSKDPTEGTVSPAMLVFSGMSWSTPQSVTITGVDDNEADGNVAYQVACGPAMSTDTTYNSLPATLIDLVNDDDDAPFIRVSPITNLVTSEAQAQATFTMILESKPSGPVTIGLSSDNPKEGVVGTKSVTFTSTDWNVEKTITVTGVDDRLDDGDVAYTVVTSSATSTDTQYAGMNPADVQVVNTDDDTAAVVVTPVSGLTTTEGGGEVRFTVVLDSLPLYDIAIPIESSNPSEGTPSTPRLTFTVTSWNIMQTVTVKGVDDNAQDGDVKYTIALKQVVSNDPAYSALDPPDVEVTNTDDDVAGVVVSQRKVQTTEAGGVGVFTVRLATVPAAEVTISVDSLDSTEGTVSPTTLRFTPVTWSAPQTVTVSGVDDKMVDGDVQFTISVGTPSSTDPLYSMLPATTVEGTNKDDDTVGMAVAPTTGLVTAETGGTATFTVVLLSEPAGEVTVPLMSQKTTEVTVAPQRLVFSKASWSTPRTVSVTGVDDAKVDGDQVAVVVVGPPASTDSAYQAIPAVEVEVVNSDDDVASIIVAPTTGLVTDEAGGEDTFTIVLGSLPRADVVLSVSSGNTKEGVSTPTGLTFTPLSWNIPQTVTVRGVPDNVDDGEVAYVVRTSPVASTDKSYHGLDPPDVSVVNRPIMCTSYTCPMGMVPVVTSCANGVCDAARCCVQSCQGHPCTANKVAKANQESIACGSTCTDATCCDTTCSGFTCPSATVAKPASQVCDGGTCDAEKCCFPSCASFSCPSSMLLKPTAAGIACPAGCPPQTCCNPVCAGHACSANRRLKASPALIACLGGTCTDGMCCDVLCSSFTCPAGLGLVNTAATTVCPGGVCTSSVCCHDKCKGVTCPAVSPCRNPSTCDPSSGKCQRGSIKPNGTACDDSHPGTTGDTCQSGVCVGALQCGAASCVPTEPACQVAACSAGQCATTPKPDGTECDDGKASTVDDRCKGGKCQGTPPSCLTYGSTTCRLRSDAAAVVCPGGVCTAKVCCVMCNTFDPSLCPSSEVLGKEPCPPSGCDVPTCCVDRCAGVSCVVSDQCHEKGTCNPATGLCSDPPKSDGSPCDDNVAETTTDQCISGICQGRCGSCSAPQCSKANCSSPMCTTSPLPDGSPCNDGNPATTGDKCTGGVCSGALPLCASFSATPCQLRPDAALIRCNTACTASTCCNTCASFTSAQCVAGLLPNPTSIPCPPQGCTTDDCCRPNLCEGTSCAASVGSCSGDGVCDPATGKCLSTPKPDGTGCDDSNARTTGDRCMQGTCRGTEASVLVGVQCVLDALFSQIMADRSQLVALRDNVLQYVAAKTGAARNAVFISSLCRSDSSGRRVAATCIAGESIRHLTTSRHMVLTAADMTFIHAVASVPGSAVNGAKGNLQDAFKEGSQVAQFTVVGVAGLPANVIGVDRCATVVCDAGSQCHDVGVCDEGTGVCSNPRKPDGTPCDDGDAATSGDQCKAGGCAGSISCTGVSCTASEPKCNTATCKGNVCSEAPKADGTPCNDDNPTTVDDRCIGGVCRGIDNCRLVSCAASDQCHAAGRCDPATGRCTDPPLPDGTACDDGDTATGGDKCVSGVCIGTVSCGGELCYPSSPECYTAACNSGQCSQQVKVDGTLCNDGDLLTTGDQCKQGTCRGIDRCLQIVCKSTRQCIQDGHCNPQTGKCLQPPVQDGTACDDGDSTTMGDKCVAGVCVGSVVCGGVTCQVVNAQCHTAGCDDAQKCIEVPKADGTLCDDGSTATVDDRCVKGVCTGIDTCAGVVCEASDQCHAVGVCDPLTARCTDPRKSDGTSCTDGDPTTASDKCLAGTCTGSLSCGGRACMPTQPQCHVATCAGSICTQRQKPDGTKCNDENPSTVNDRCFNGRCVGTDYCASVRCKASDQCHRPGVCNPADGTCSDPPEADGTLCSDGDGATTGDQCIGGVCIGMAPCGTASCVATMPNCNIATCILGLCSEKPKPDGTTCNDGDGSTANDRCIGGVCTGAVFCAGVACLPADPQCHTPACDGSRCTQQVKPDGTRCNDGLVSTSDDRCVGGKCVGTDKCAGVVCVASDGCHMAGVCDGKTGMCTDPVKPDGSVCSDGDASTTGDKCISGFCTGSVSCSGTTCIPTDPACHTAACLNGQCTQRPKPTGTACNDGNPLTVRDVCVSGKCLGVDNCAHVACAASDQCHDVGTCNPLTGECSDPVKPDGTVCDDGEATTVGDKCMAGKCVGSISCGGVTCTAPDPRCQVPSCSQGKCSQRFKPDNTPCNDGTAVTGGDVCKLGKCIGVDRCANLVCTAISQCHEAGTCHRSTGVCTNPRKADGTQCDDNNPATLRDACLSGVCVGEIPCGNSVCRPSEPQCFIPQCLAGRCTQAPQSDGTTCDDGDALTVGDRCAKGGCAGSLSCNGQACLPQDTKCHVARCEGGRCTQTSKQDGTPCDDGDAKTSDDVCSQGVCSGIDKCATVVCTTTTVCHKPSQCDPRTGLCVGEPLVDGTPCDDGDASTVDDKCMSGECLGTIVCGGYRCPPSTLPCVRAVCERGRCSEVDKPDGTSCDDALPTTSDDKCVKGTCVGWISCGPNLCIASNPDCFEAFCDGTSCGERFKSDGAVCTDHNPLTVRDSCRNGVCRGTDLCRGVICTASDQCHDVGVCEPHTGGCTDPPKPQGTVCNDGIPTTTGDKCIDGTCTGSVVCGGVSCTASKPRCHIPTCDGGVCTEVPKADGAKCNDGNVTTVWDKCSAGECKGDDRCAGVECKESDQCHTAGVCNSLTGLCSDPAKPDGTPCDDGDKSTINDRCLGGACTGSVLCSGEMCTPSTPLCTTPVCGTQGQCAVIAKPDGSSCNDGNSSTTSDSCVGGKCVGKASHCLPSPCGSSQICADASNTGIIKFTCTCKPPLVGQGVDAPAVCRVGGEGECSTVTLCNLAGQRCVDPSSAPNDWRCTCIPPLQGSAVRSAAQCIVADEDSSPRVVMDMGTAAVALGATTWGKRLAAQLGVSPTRVMVTPNGDRYAVSFLDPSEPDASPVDPSYPANGVDKETLAHELVRQAACCPAECGGLVFCTELGVVSLNLAATPCRSLSHESVCAKKAGCTWGAQSPTPCFERDDDDDVSSLAWILPVALGIPFLFLLAVAVYITRAKRAGKPPTGEGLSTPIPPEHPPSPAKEVPAANDPGKMVYTPPDIRNNMKFSPRTPPDNDPVEVVVEKKWGGSHPDMDSYTRGLSPYRSPPLPLREARMPETPQQDPPPWLSDPPRSTSPLVWGSGRGGLPTILPPMLPPRDVQADGDVAGNPPPGLYPVKV